MTKQNVSPTKAIKQLQAAEADLLRQQTEGSQKKQATVQIIPTTQHILENYPILTVAEKNRLWKPVMRKATVYRPPENKLSTVEFFCKAHPEPDMDCTEEAPGRDGFCRFEKKMK